MYIAKKEFIISILQSISAHSLKNDCRGWNCAISLHLLQRRWPGVAKEERGAVTNGLEMDGSNWRWAIHLKVRLDVSRPISSENKCRTEAYGQEMTSQAVCPSIYHSARLKQERMAAADDVYSLCDKRRWLDAGATSYDVGHAFSQHFGVYAQGVKCSHFKVYSGVGLGCISPLYINFA